MAYAIAQCLSVYLSVTFVDSVETNKHIFKFVLPPSSHTIRGLSTGQLEEKRREPHHSSLSVPNVMAIFRRGPLMGTLNAGGVGKNHDSRPISGFQIDDW